ncbi:MAG: hypothetical protein KJO18_06955 [Acidimicrobiia bacterium]|nr:hypothetical protein [Acidimicrobiia bacterium]
MKRSVVATMIIGGMLLAQSIPALAGGGGQCVDRPVTSEATSQVDLTHNCFGPTTARIAPGESVTFLNRDTVPHTVTGANLAWGSTQHLGFGEELSVRFDEPGIYPYVCVLHVGMVGAVEVVDGVDGLNSAGAERSVLASPLGQSVSAVSSPANGFAFTLGVWVLAMTAVLATAVWAIRPMPKETS